MTISIVINILTWLFLGVTWFLIIKTRRKQREIENIFFEEQKKKCAEFNKKVRGIK